MLPPGALAGVGCPLPRPRCLGRCKPRGAAKRYRHEKATVRDCRHLLRRNCISRCWGRLDRSRVSSASRAGTSNVGLEAVFPAY